MPWKQKDMLSMKREIVLKALSKQVNISILAKENNISRKTIYEWMSDYKELGEEGLLALSTRPHTSPNRIGPEIVDLILSVRNRFKVLGGRKLRQILVNEGYLEEELPSVSTFNRLIKVHGLVDPLESEKREHFIRFEKEKPNDLWQMDFKGHFKMGDQRCHPLTVLDDHSRFSIVLKACLGETYDVVQNSLELAFREYGLPEAMTMDNGSPWKGSPPWTLSRLTVWLMRLGIRVSHSSVRHPQTQGKLERFHRSFKCEVLKFHQFKSLEYTQEIFDDWRDEYNFQRPHEGINLLCPAQRYVASTRIYPDKLPEIEYKDSDELRKVQANGVVFYKGLNPYVGEHLRGQLVAIRPTSKDGINSIYFLNNKVGQVNIRNRGK